MKRDKMETAISARNELPLHDTEHHQHQHEECRRSKEKKVFTLETYLDFLHTRNLHNLTVDHLNKIVSIHGYKKAINRKSAEAAVGAITDIIHPARSTLKGSPLSAASGKAAVTLTEAVKDLKLLNWQECSVTSIRIISPKNYSIPAATVKEIVSIHGYKKTINRKSAEEAVGAITDLIHPARSTLKGSPPSAASGKAAVTLIEAENEESSGEQGGDEEAENEEFGGEGGEDGDEEGEESDEDDGEESEDDGEESEDEEDEVMDMRVEVVWFPNPHAGQPVGDIDLSQCLSWENLWAMLHNRYEQMGGMLPAVLTMQGCWPGGKVVIYTRGNHEIEVGNFFIQQVRNLIGKIYVYAI